MDVSPTFSILIPPENSFFSPYLTSEIIYSPQNKLFSSNNYISPSPLMIRSISQSPISSSVFFQTLPKPSFLCCPSGKISRENLKSNAGFHSLLKKKKNYNFTQERSKFGKVFLSEFGDSRITERRKMATAAYGPSKPPIVIPASGKHSATIVWLHGLGDTGNGWSDISGMMNLPHIKWVIPTAPIQPVLLNGGYPCTSWFDIRGLTPDSPEDIEGLDAAATYVGNLLSKEYKNGEGESEIKVAVGGFSQGGALSMYLTSRTVLGKLNNGTETDDFPPLSASICLSGWLPNARSFSLPENSVASEKAAKLPVLLCHGTADPLVPASFGQMSAEKLRLSGFSNVEFKAYPGMAHEANQAEMVYLRYFLLQQFPIP